MASLLFTLATAFVFLARLGNGTLEDYCTDVSYFDTVQYTTTTKECCETQLKQVCTSKSDTVCKEVLDLKCEVAAWADCKSTTTSTPGKKCSVEYKDYELKDCKEVKTSTLHTKQVPDCKKVTKNNCVTDWEVDSNGNKVWTGTETCTPVTWEECGIVEKQVEFPSVETECNTVANIKWADFVEKTKETIGLETTCEVKNSVECKKVSVNKCTKLDWRECSWRPVQQCEAVFVSEPSQEKVHRKKCLNTGADSGLLSGPLSLSLSFPEDLSGADSGPLSLSLSFPGDLSGAVVMNNIGYLFRGYDIMKGNPLQVEGLPQDPGYRQPIFKATYESGSRTADLRYLQPDGTSITDCSGTCSLNFETFEISGSKSYQDSLSRKALFTLGGYGAKFSASTDYKKVHTTTSSGSSLYTQSFASCCSYSAQTHGFDGPPLSKNFLIAVKTLTDEYKEEVYQRIIQNFGTHFIMEAQMGALYGLQSEVSKEAWTSMLEKGLTITTAASAQAKGIAVGGEFSNSNEKTISEEFASSITSQKIFTIGVKPPTDQKIESWVQATSSAPAPMKLRLGSIMDLFNGFHGIEVTDAVKENMRKALKDYCPLLVQRGEVSTCEEPGPDPPKPVLPMKRTWMGWSNGNFNGHTNPVKQCSDGHYVDRMIWMSQNNYGIVDLKFTCSDDTIYRMADNKNGKDDRQMNCEGSKGGFRQMTGRRRWHWGIINVRSFCFYQETQQTANDDLNGWWEQTRMCNKNEKIVGIQTQEQNGYGFVNFQFQCAIVPSGTDSGCAKQDNIDYYGNDIPGKNKVVSGLEECANWCGETPECRYWTYGKSDRHCYLKISNIGVTNDADRISGTKNCATECVKEDNTDYYGNDIPGKNKIVSGVEECANWCGETPECRYWTYGKSDRHCYLKTSDSGRYENAGRISGTEKCATGCVREDNTDYYGNDIPGKNKIVTGLQECIGWCGETTECGYWTYKKSDKRCFLKTSEAGRDENDDGISGTKKCGTS